MSSLCSLWIEWSACVFVPRFFRFCNGLDVWYSDLIEGTLFTSLQESIKTKHPQLHYESKLYMLLQGGSEYRVFYVFS